MVNDTEGFANAATGLGQGDATINLDIDRDKVRAYGLTVAQVYQQIAAKLTTTTTAETPVTVDSSTMKVQISDNLDPVTKENMMDMTFTTSVMDATGTTTTGTCTLGDIASWTTGTAPDSITSENQTRYITVTADTLDGYNTTVQSRVLQKTLDAFAPHRRDARGCSFSLGGESSTVNLMVDEMVQWMALALPFVYLVMVAQFQSLLSPFIVLFTVPLAFTGGLLGMLVTGQQLTMISLMGFIVLMGTVVNNGIVFVDYANQLRLGGLERRAAPCRHRQDPYASHPHDHPDHRSGHAADGVQQRYGEPAHERHGHRHHLRPELCHPDDPVHRPHPLRHPLQEAAAGGRCG